MLEAKLHSAICEQVEITPLFEAKLVWETKSNMSTYTSSLVLREERGWTNS